jgi:hypothetical protein
MTAIWTDKKKVIGLMNSIFRGRIIALLKTTLAGRSLANLDLYSSWPVSLRRRFALASSKVGA